VFIGFINHLMPPKEWAVKRFPSASPLSRGHRMVTRPGAYTMGSMLARSQPLFLEQCTGRREVTKFFFGPRFL